MLINQEPLSGSADASPVAGGNPSDPPGGVPSFAPFLVEPEDERGIPALHLYRSINGMAATAECVWTAELDEPQLVRRTFEWMRSRPEMWPVWGRAVEGLGTGFLSRLIERDSAEAVRSPVPSPSPEVGDVGGVGAGAVPGGTIEPEPVPKKPSLWCWCIDDGYGSKRSYRLVLCRGKDERKSFFSLRYDKASERDRVWDWMQHQGHRYSEFERHVADHGRDRTKKFIYGGMLETERAVKKAGMGSGGLRPLRFWPGPESSGG